MGTVEPKVRHRLDLPDRTELLVMGEPQPEHAVLFGLDGDVRIHRSWWPGQYVIVAHRKQRTFVW